MQAVFSNPNSQVYLIGDDENDVYEFVAHENIIDYSARANEFACIYQHLSSNSRSFELFCFQRWFVLREFLEKKGINECLYVDSDVMLYADVTEEQERFRSFEFTLHSERDVNCMFINEVSTLGDLCEFVFTSYEDPSKLGELRALHKDCVDAGVSGGICDMTVWEQYAGRNPERVGDTSVIIERSTFDSSMCVSNGFEMGAGMKKIRLIDGQPHCLHIESGQQIKFCVLHFQGQSKEHLAEYFTGSTLECLWRNLQRNWKNGRKRLAVLLRG